VKIVKEGDGLERICQVTATALIAQDAPALETSNCLLDPGSVSTMSTPPAVAQDLVPRNTGVMSNMAHRYDLASSVWDKS
jgi:hypothetical protein